MFYLTFSGVLHFFLAFSLHLLVYTAMSQLNTLLGIGIFPEIAKIIDH